jgi:hypothetical protein
MGGGVKRRDSGNLGQEREFRLRKIDGRKAYYEEDDQDTVCIRLHLIFNGTSTLVSINYGFTILECIFVITDKVYTSSGMKIFLEEQNESCIQEVSNKTLDALLLKSAYLTT